ncbi:MAG TPA: glycosyltransferase family 2 protein [Thermoanaerobaculia bacterium]|nr:glycosyltransferase family 2 protein [Thermoanaerobaculia bacterium]
MSEGGVAAVIVHYRTPEETAAAARSVAETSARSSIVVVDNASGDAIAERLAREVPAARVLAQPSNRGYGAGCNRGAREGEEEFLLFLNSDARVLPGAVSALVSALLADPRAAVAGPRLQNPDGGPQASIQRFPTPWRIFCESSGLAAISRGRLFRGHTKTREDHSRPSEVESLKGAVLLVRRSAFEEAGGFDEDFFLYAEETDLMRRLSDRGWRILFVPQALALHAGGGSGGDALFGLVHEGLARYARKHHGAAGARFAAACLWAGAAARYAAALVTPGAAGHRRRIRYRSALKGKALLNTR